MFAWVQNNISELPSPMAAVLVNQSLPYATGGTFAYHLE